MTESTYRTSIFGRSSRSVIAVFLSFLMLLPPRHSAEAAVTSYGPAYGTDIITYESFDSTGFDLPEKYGKISARHEGDRRGGVIHIQDAHCNYGLQCSIFDLLGYLRKHYDIDVINLEGGAGDYDLSVFESIEDRGLRADVAQYFLRQGVINAAEFFAIVKEADVGLWGVEDPVLYLENLKAYRETSGGHDRALSLLNALRQKIDLLSPSRSSDSLREFVRMSDRYQKGKSSTVDHVVFLGGLIDTFDIDISGMDEFPRILEVTRLDGSIDFDAAGRQRDMLIDRLREKMSVNEIERLARKMSDFGNGSLSRSRFYVYLTGKGTELGVMIDDLGDLFDYARYVRAFDSIDILGLRSEIIVLENLVLKELSAGGKEKLSVSLSRRTRMLEDLLELRLKEWDHRDFKEHRNRFTVERLISDLETLSPGAGASLPSDIRFLDEYVSVAESFYEASAKRDQAFMENLELGEDGTAVTVLVTGGFHSERIMEMLKARGIPAVSVIPAKQQSANYPSRYNEILEGKRDKISRAIDAVSGRMQVASMLSEMAPAVWEKDDIESFRTSAVLMSIMLETGGPVTVLGKDGRKILFYFEGDNVAVSDITSEKDVEGVAVRVSELRKRAGKTTGIFRKSRIKEASDNTSFPVTSGAEGLDRLEEMLVGLVNADEPLQAATIADRHGNMDRLERDLAKVPEETEEIVFLGDYMDRGPNGILLVETLIDLQARRDCVFLMGNHDLMFMLAMAGSVNDMDQWLLNGGTGVLREAGYDPVVLDLLEKRIASTRSILAVLGFKISDPERYKDLVSFARNNKRLVRVFNWMKNSLRMYHVGRDGRFRIHANFPMDSYGNLKMRWLDADGKEYSNIFALARMEELAKKAIAEGDVEAPVIKRLSVSDPDGAKDGYVPERNSPLWVRAADIEDKYSPDLETSVIPGREEKIMSQIGLSVMEAGHTPRSDKDPDRINYGDRIFMLDQYWRMEDGAVSFNDAEGFKITRIPEETVTVMDADEYRAKFEESRSGARDLLKELRSKYRTTGATDLIGKLFTDEGRIATEILVVRDEHNDDLALLDPAKGSPLKDKYGEEVSGLEISKGHGRDVPFLADRAVRELRMLYRGLYGDGVQGNVDEEVLKGVIDILERSEIGLISPNRHGVLGVSRRLGGHFNIYIDERFADHEDLLPLVLFHEAAEILISERPDLLPEGMNAHQFLRGAPASERERAVSSSFEGVQDRLFGWANDELSYRIRVMNNDRMTDDERRLFGAIFMAEDDMKIAADILKGERPPLPVTSRTAEEFLKMRKAYVDARKRFGQVRDRSVIEGNELYRRLKIIERELQGDDKMRYRFVSGQTCALEGLGTSRVTAVLQRVMRGEQKDISSLPTESGMASRLIRKVIKDNVMAEGREGLFMNLPGGKEVVIVGDLHTRGGNLISVLGDDRNIDKLRRGEIHLVILGDAVHADPRCFLWGSTEDRDKMMREMDSSVEIMKRIFRLKADYPDNVHYIIGNHDYFSPYISKHSIQQGILFRDKLMERYGPGYVKTYEDFVKTSPFILRTADGLVCTHAGPVRMETASSVEEINAADTSDPHAPVVYDLTWRRWEAADGLEKYAYYAGDVNDFLSLVDGKVHVVGHDNANIPTGDFYAELMPGRHYVTIGGRPTPGYLRFKNGKIEPVRLSDSLSREETELAGSDIYKRIRAKRQRLDAQEVPEGLSERTYIRTSTRPNYELRIKALEDVFGGLEIIKDLGGGTFGRVIKVADGEGRTFALKLAGGRTVEQRRDPHKAIRVFKAADLPFAVIMKQASSQLDWMPTIIAAGIHDNEPYVAMEVVEEYNIIDRGFLADRTAAEVEEIARQIAFIVGHLEARGLIMFDEKISNFGWKDGKVVLLDTGSCDVSGTVISPEARNRLEEMGVMAPNAVDNVEKVLRAMADKLGTYVRSVDPEMSSEDMENIMLEARARVLVDNMYDSASALAGNIRDRKRPVVIFMREPETDEGHYSLVRRLERTMKRKYDTENIRVMLYDGTSDDLDNAVGRVSDILEEPGSRAVVYLPSEYYPSDAAEREKFLFVREDCEDQDMIAMAGPRIVLALALVNYAEGQASPALLDTLEMALKSLTDDTGTLMAIREHGIEKYLDDLIAGIGKLKMRKIDLNEMRDAVKAQEEVLYSL